MSVQLNIHFREVNVNEQTARFRYIRIPAEQDAVTPSKMNAPDVGECWAFWLQDGMAYLGLDLQNSEQAELLNELFGGGYEIVKCPHCSAYVPQDKHCDQCGREIPYLLTHDADLLF